MNGDRCLPKNGYFESFTRVATACSDGCLYCTSQTACITCNSGYVIEYSACIKCS